RRQHPDPRGSRPRVRCDLDAAWCDAYRVRNSAIAVAISSAWVQGEVTGVDETDVGVGAAASEVVVVEPVAVRTDPRCVGDTVRSGTRPARRSRTRTARSGRGQVFPSGDR